MADEDRSRRIDLGDGIIVSVADVLARLIERGGMRAWEDVIDEIIIEHRGVLDPQREAHRLARRAAGIGPARPERPPRIPIDEPRPIAGSDGIRYATWSGDGIVGYRCTGGRIDLFAWPAPSGEARHVATLHGLATLGPTVSPHGDRIGLHYMLDGRPGGGWCDDFSACVHIDAATGEEHVIVASTPEFRVRSHPVWSSDGALVAVAGTDMRGDPPHARSVRVHDVDTRISIASIDRRTPMHVIRFDHDGVLLETQRDHWVRWRPGTTTLVDVPCEQRWHYYAWASAQEACCGLDETPDGRVLLPHAGALAWSRRR